MKRILLFLALATLAFTAACGSDDDPTVDSGGSGGGAAEHNDADVEFAQMMIPHHEQAVEMAEMALENSESDAVNELATRIKEAQGPEIATMKGWLEDWDEPLQADSGGMGGMDMGGDDSSGEGMMSDDDMEEMESASGAAFDKLFLEGMIAHHKGAVAMAEIELEEGEFPDALALAQEVVDAQEAEITEMESLLAGDTTTTTGP
jgi:uncharacterized protein (DUF305 family)